MKSNVQAELPGLIGFVSVGRSDAGSTLPALMVGSELLRLLRPVALQSRRMPCRLSKDPSGHILAAGILAFFLILVAVLKAFGQLADGLRLIAGGLKLADELEGDGHAFIIHETGSGIRSSSTGRSLLLNQRLQQRLPPGPRLRIVGPEPGPKFPIRPAEAALLRLADHGFGPACPRWHVGGGEGAELSQENGPTMLLRPGCDSVEIAPDCFFLFWRTRPCRTQPAYPVRSPATGVSSWSYVTSP